MFMPGWKLDFSMCLKKGTLEREWVKGHSLVERINVLQRGPKELFDTFAMRGVLVSVLLLGKDILITAIL